MTDILCTTLGALAHAAKREFAAEHGTVPNSRIALVALDAAGRREFATGGPLRLLFLYDNDPLPPGVMPLAPDAWHQQLFGRLMVLIRALSPEGTLFEAVPGYALYGDDAGEAHALTAFRQRFADAPPVADLRMLTHARVVEAEDGLGEDFEALRQSVLSRANDVAAIAADVAAARRSGLRPAGPWDVARLEGGLADIVLAAEYLQLAGASPETGVATLAETLARSGDRGLLAGDAARDLIDSAALWQNLDGFFRMTCAGAFDPDAATLEQKAIIAGMCGTVAFEDVADAIAAASRRSARHLGALWSALPTAGTSP